MERIDAQVLGDFAQARIAPQFFFENGDEQVHAHRDPDLSLHRVVGVAVKVLDPQMLLDPFEEDLHPPPTSVELGNRQCWQIEVVGEKDEMLSFSAS